jgi:4-carboxymuconolactone decarboxylase
LDVPLDRPTAALLGFATAAASGREAVLVERARAAQTADVPLVWLDELVLQSVLMVGWPRALIAAGVWRRESGMRAPAADGAAGQDSSLWRRRGEETCQVVYGGNYSRLRENVRALHPALDEWMVSDGYGKVLSRPGLDLARRELCVVAQTAVLGAERQLHSHLRGALHAGASPALVGQALEVIAADLDGAGDELVRRTWRRVVEV